MQVKKLVG